MSIIPVYAYEARNNISIVDMPEELRPLIIPHAPEGYMISETLEALRAPLQVISPKSQLPRFAVRGSVESLQKHSQRLMQSIGRIANYGSSIAENVETAADSQPAYDSLLSFTQTLQTMDSDTSMPVVIAKLLKPFAASYGDPLFFTDGTKAPWTYPTQQLETHAAFSTDDLTKAHPQLGHDAMHVLQKAV